jgi:ribonuclease P/MRP protein subunit POP3
VRYERGAGFDLIASLLEPIGTHRRMHVTPSKGKRKRTTQCKEQSTLKETSSTDEKVTTPDQPEISSHILVGLSSITRYMEKMVTQRISCSVAATADIPDPSSPAKEGDRGSRSERALAAIFVCRSSQPSVLHVHLPQLVASASLAVPTSDPIRLVQLPQGCEERLCSALNLPSVGFVALYENAPNSNALLDLVRRAVPAIEVPWLVEAQSTEFKRTKINAISTPLPPTDNKQKGAKKTKLTGGRD